MKKFWKNLIILPLLLVTALCFYACKDDSLKSISLSISEDGVIENTEHQGNYKYYILPMKRNESYKISVTLNPSSYTAENLTWTSSNTSCIKFVRKGYINTIDEGESTLTASYTNSDGKEISSAIKVKVTKEPPPAFMSDYITIMYEGENLANRTELRAINENKDYEYSYSEFGQSGQIVSEIVNVGKYEVIYKTKEDIPYIHSVSTIVEVVPVDVVITAPDGESSYGDAIQSGGTSGDGSGLTIFDVDRENLKPEHFTNSITKEKFAVGKDRDTSDGKDSLGKYALYTNARKGFKVGNTYFVDLAIELDEEYSKNYNFIITKGKYSITPKKVLLVVLEQEIFYGAHPVPNLYKLCDYDLYEENGKNYDILKDLKEDEEIPYSEQLIIGQYKLTNVATGQVENLNNYDCYNKGEYVLGYKNEPNVKDGNIVIQEIISEKLFVRPKVVEITPHSNSKVYGTEDDASAIEYEDNGIINRKEVTPFLKINYGDGGADYGVGNIKAPVREYSYTINENITNPNYVFRLSKEGLESGFRVEPCPVIIRFKDKLDEKYKNPKIGGVHKIGYYTNATNKPEYLVELDYIKINGQFEQDNPKVVNKERFLIDGKFEFPTGEKLYLSSLNALSVPTSSDNVAMSYQIGTRRPSINFSDGDIQNFNISFEKSVLNLLKTIIMVTPNASDNLGSKIYDAKQEAKLSDLKGFLGAVTLFPEPQENLSNILSSPEVLTLKNPDGKYVMVENGSEKEVTTFADCGKYKVFLETLQYKEGKEYYDFRLNEDSVYCFTIKPYTLQITPKEGQKVYGNGDPILDFEFDQNKPQDGLGKDDFKGELSRLENIPNDQRAFSENVGSYTISLGTLSLGKNYKLALSDENIKFTIIPRHITIKPISSTVKYGYSFPKKINYEDIDYGVYDPMILKFPTFSSNEFELQREDKKPVKKIGGHYPVYEVDGVVKPYTITQGAFTCNDPNYIIDFVEGVQFTITKKDITLNIRSRSISQSDKIDLNKQVDLETNDYTISGLVASDMVYPTSLITKATLTFNEALGEYSIAKKEDMTILLTFYGEDITHCYNINLNLRVLYTIEKQTIYVNIGIKDDKYNSSVEVVYNAKEQSKDLLTLVCSTPGYEISLEESQFDFVYACSEKPEQLLPVNVGSYVASLELNKEKGDKLVFINTLSPDQEKITVTQLGKTEGFYKVESINNAQINITKAPINILPDTEITFANHLIYGSSLKDLPNILIRNKQDIAIFTDVLGNEITLRNFENCEGIAVNYKFINEGRPIEQLPYSTTPHDVLISLQAMNNGMPDTNYEVLDNLVAKLYIDRKPIKILEDVKVYMEFDSLKPDRLFYTGFEKSCFASMKTDSSESNYNIAYSYTRFKTVYEEGGSYIGAVPATSNGVLEAMSVEALRNKNFTSIEINEKGLAAHSGNDVYILPTLISHQRVDAGIYMCSISFSFESERQKNFVFVAEDGSELEQINRIVFFEIEKNTEIDFAKDEQDQPIWKKEFYYGTEFNLNKPDSLPFVYELSDPSFKQYIRFETAENWTKTVLDIKNDYSVTLVIDRPNYFFKKSPTFSVVSCKAQIVFPDSNKFVFDGNPKKAFLEDIKVILMDKDGNPQPDIVDYNEKMFHATFYQKNDTENALPDAPSEVGYYILRLEYGSKKETHYGKGDFEYQIDKMVYDGSITIPPSDIVYDSTRTADELYNHLIGMVTVKKANKDKAELGKDYTLNMYLQGNVEIRRDNEKDWLEKLNIAGITTINFEIKFLDQNVAPVLKEGTLIINKQDLAGKFEYVEKDSKFPYNGYARYNELKFDSFVTLLPPSEGTPELIVQNGRKKYIVRGNPNNMKISVSDSLGREVFNLQYKYELSVKGAFNKIEGLPIAPSPTGEKYRIVYEIIHIGDNYDKTDDKNFAIENREFVISKAETLYVKFPTTYEVFYNGKDFRDSFMDKELEVANKARSGKNMKVTLSYNPISTDYYDKYGVKFVVRLEKKGVAVGDEVTFQQVNEIIESGEYKITISLIRIDNYKLPNYFTDVVINGDSYNPIPSTDFTGSSTAYFFDNYNLICNFEVKPKEFEYNYSNYKDISSLITGYSEFVKGNTEEKSVIYIDSTSRLAFTSDKYQVKFYRQVGAGVTEECGSSFEELLPVSADVDTSNLDKTYYNEYIMKFESLDPNYANSVAFTIRKKAPQPEITEPPVPEDKPVETVAIIDKKRIK